MISEFILTYYTYYTTYLNILSIKCLMIVRGKKATLCVHSMAVDLKYIR